MASDRDYIAQLALIQDLNLRTLLFRLNDAITQLRVDLTVVQVAAVAAGTAATALAARVTTLEQTVQGILTSGFDDYGEIGDPPAPGQNTARLYARDNGSGKTQLVARFNTGAVQQVALEP